MTEELNPKEKSCACGGHGHHHHEEMHHGCGCGGHHHFDPHADLGLRLSFEGELQADRIKAWKLLTDNDTLQKWQSQVKVQDLVSGGKMIVNDGEQDHELMLMDVEAPELLSFLWGQDTITLSLYEVTEATCRFIFEYWFADGKTAAGKAVAPWLMAINDLEVYLTDADYNGQRDQLQKEIETEIDKLIADNQGRTFNI